MYEACAAVFVWIFENCVKKAVDTLEAAKAPALLV